MVIMVRLPIFSFPTGEEEEAVKMIKWQISPSSTSMFSAHSFSLLIFYFQLSFAIAPAITIDKCAHLSCLHSVYILEVCFNGLLL